VAGVSAIDVCNNGCTWTTDPCAQVCLANGYVDKSSGCANNWTTHLDVCWCPPSLSQDVMIWTFRDACNDGIGPNVGLFDVTVSATLGTYFLQTYNAPLATSITCTTGHKICFGAWEGSTYWGCGQYCLQTPSQPNCYICGSQLSSVEEDLGC
jgi:hypothetical protein